MSSTKPIKSTPVANESSTSSLLQSNGTSDTFSADTSMVRKETPTADTGISYDMADDGALADRVGGGRAESMSLMGASAPKTSAEASYVYVYSGSNFPLLANISLPVYKHTGGLSIKNATNLTKNFSIENLDVNTLQSTSLEALSLKENIDYGYSLDFQLREGAITVSPNLPFWKELYCENSPCVGNINYSNAKSLPSDESIATSAKKLADKLAIDATRYGKPVVLSPSEGERINSADFGVDADVLLPLRFENLPTYDTFGGLIGAHVSVNMRVQKATAMYGLISGVFTPSTVILSSDKAALLKKASVGGIWASGRSTSASHENAKVIALSTPHLAYVSIYQDNDWTYVPCLVFPLKGANPEGAYLPKNIIVPLATEF